MSQIKEIISSQTFFAPDENNQRGSGAEKVRLRAREPRMLSYPTLSLSISLVRCAAGRYAGRVPPPC